MALIVFIILAVSPSTPFMQKLHNCWLTWVYGAYVAISIPHLEGVSQIEVYLYYL